MSESAIITIVSFFLLRIFVINERTFPNLKGKNRTFDVAAFGAGFLVYFLFVKCYLIFESEKEFTGIPTSMALFIGLLILSLAFFGLRIPAEGVERDIEARKLWWILFPTSFLLMLYLIVGKLLPVPFTPPEGSRWHLVLYGIFSLAACGFSIHFRKSLGIIKTAIGVLPFLIPVALGIIVMHKLQNT